jgi:threonine dehydratase
VREIALRAHLVAEPSGATALAAYLSRETPPGPTVVVVSGGNVEPALLAGILAG